MKFFSMPLWKIILIIISGLILTGGLTLGILFLTNKLEEEKVYPEEILFVYDDSDQTSYKVTTDFKITITTNTKEVNKNEITLSLVGEQNSKKGYITDGNIIVPKTVKIDEAFTVELVKNRYEGLIDDWVKGGISTLTATSENELIDAIRTTISVDVPVSEISLQLFDNADTLFENAKTNITVGSTFVAQTKFNPIKSEYVYSNNNEKKEVFYESLSQNISFDSETGLFKATQINLNLEKSTIKAYTFKTAKDRETVYAKYEGMSGNDYYNAIITELKNNPSICVSTEIEVSVVPVNISYFSVSLSSSATNPINITTNKIFTISGNSRTSRFDSSLGITIQGEEDQNGAPENLNSMIKHVGIVLYYFDAEKSEYVLATEDDDISILNSSDTISLDGKDYYLPDILPSDPNAYNWEIVTSTPNLDIKLEVYLFEENLDGSFTLYKGNDEKVDFFEVYLYSVESQESAVRWNNTDDIELVLTYEEDSNISPSSTSSFYDTSKNYMFIDENNLYQQKELFVTFKEKEIPTDKTALLGYKGFNYDKYGMITLDGDSYVFYHLSNDYLTVNKYMTGMELYFATIVTTIAGDPIYDENNWYTIAQLSENYIRIIISETLDVAKIAENSVYEVDNSQKFYTKEVENTNPYEITYIPTGSKNAVDLKIIQLDIDELTTFENSIKNTGLDSSKDKLRVMAYKDGTYYDFFDLNILPDTENVTMTLKLTFNQSKYETSFPNYNLSGSDNGIIFSLYYEYYNTIETRYYRISENSDLAIYSAQPVEALYSYEDMENPLIPKEPMNVRVKSDAISIAFSENETPIDNLTELNNRLKVILLDQFEREVDPNDGFFDYVLETSNSNAISINRLEKTISFYAVNGVTSTLNGYVVDKNGQRVKAVNDSGIYIEGENLVTTLLTFYIESDGVSRVEYDNSTNYDDKDFKECEDINEGVVVSKIGLRDSEIKLVDIINVYTGEYTQDSAPVETLKFKLSAGYYSKLSENAKKELFVGDQENGSVSNFFTLMNGTEEISKDTFTADSNITDIKINYNAGTDIEIELTVYDESGIIDISLTLKILQAATFNNLFASYANSEEYRKDVVNRVNEATGEVVYLGVYAQDEIDIKSFLPISINGQDNPQIDAANIIITSSENCFTFTNGMLKFNDVFENTSKTIRVYFETQSSYTAYTSITFNVNTNFFVKEVVKTNGNEKEYGRNIDILTDDLDFGNHYTIVRIDGTEILDTNIKFENISNDKYFRINNTETSIAIERLQPINISVGEYITQSFKMTYNSNNGVILDVKNNLNNLITFDLLVTADFTITDFISTALINETSSVSSEVNYDGGERLYLVENGFYYYKKDVTFNRTDYRFDYDLANNNYVKQYTQDFRVGSIKEQFLNTSDSISVTITNTQASNIALVKITIPVLISGFGDKFAQYTNDYSIVQMLNTLTNEEVYEEVDANKTYKLVYDMSDEDDVKELENNGFGLVYTSLVANGNGVRYLDMKDIAIYEVYRIVDGSKEILSSSLAKIEDKNIIFSHLNSNYEAYVVVSAKIVGATSQNRDRSQTVYFRFKVKGDVNIGDVIYPYYDYDNENTDIKAEYINIDLDETLSINLEEKFDLTNSNANINDSNENYEGFKKYNKTRFFVFENSTSVQFRAISLTVNGVNSNISSYFEISFNDGIMSIKRINSPIVENSKMILVIEKSYTDIVGSEQLYTFYINSGKTYILDYKRDGESLIPNNDELNINTHSGKQEFKLTFTLKEQSIGGGTDTTVTENILGFRYTDAQNTTGNSIYNIVPALTFNNSTYTLSFTLNKFIGKDLSIYLYIYTNQGIIQTIKVNIEGNVAVKMNKNDNLYGGTEITAESLIESINYNGKSINSYESYDKEVIFNNILEGAEVIKLSNDGSSIEVAQLKENINIKVEINILIINEKEDNLKIGTYSFEYSFVVKANLVYNDTDKTIVQSNKDYATSVVIKDKNVYYAGETIEINRIDNDLGILTTLNNSNKVIRESLDAFNSLNITYTSEYVSSASVEGNSQLASINTKSSLALESVKIVVLVEVEYSFNNSYTYNFYINYEFTIYKNIELSQNYPDPDETNSLKAEYITVNTEGTSKATQKLDNFFVSKAELASDDNYVITPVYVRKNGIDIKYSKLASGTKVGITANEGDVESDYVEIFRIDGHPINSLKLGTDKSKTEKIYVLRDCVSDNIITKETFIYIKTSSRILVDSYFNVNENDGDTTVGVERISNSSVYSVSVKSLNNISLDISYINNFNEVITINGWKNVGIIKTESGSDTLDYYGFSSFGFKFYKLAEASGESYVTFAITINGVTVDYTVYLNENVYSLKNVYIRENSDLLIGDKNSSTPVTGEDIYVEDLVKENSEYILSQNRILTYQFNPSATRLGTAFIRYIVNETDIYNEQINVTTSALESSAVIRKDLGIKGCRYLGTYDSTSLSAKLIPDSEIYLDGKSPEFVSRVSFLYNGIVISDNKLSELNINYYTTNEHYVAFSENRKVKLSGIYDGVTDGESNLYELNTKGIKISVGKKVDNEYYEIDKINDNYTINTYTDTTVKKEDGTDNIRAEKFYVRADDLEITKTENSTIYKTNKDNVKIYYKTNGYSSLNDFFVASSDFTDTNFANEVRFVVNGNKVNALYAYRICIDFEVKEQIDLYENNQNQTSYAEEAISKAKSVTVSKNSSLVELFKVKHALDDSLVTIDDFNESANATLNAQFFGLDIAVLEDNKDDPYLKNYSTSAYYIDRYLKTVNNYETGLHPVYMPGDSSGYGYTNGLVKNNSIQYNFLTLRQKQVSETNTKAYDYELVAQGAANDGNYVMLLLDYKVEFGNEELHKYSMLLIKVLPDYVVTIEGQATESLVDTSDSSKKVQTNRNTPVTREISSDSEIYAYEIPVYGSEGNVLNVSHTNSSSVNLAKQFYYSYEEGYSTILNINTAKLFIDSTMEESISNLQDVRWESTGRDILNIYGKRCVFGDKNYIINIIDNYGYKIELYFTLKAEQSPYVAYSGYNFVEGKSYVIGSEYTALETEYNTANTTTGSGLSIVADKKEQEEIRTTTDYTSNIGTEDGKSFADSVIVGGINAYGYNNNVPTNFSSIVEILDYFGKVKAFGIDETEAKKNREEGLELLKAIALPMSFTSTKSGVTLDQVGNKIAESLKTQINNLGKQNRFGVLFGVIDNVGIIKIGDSKDIEKIRSFIAEGKKNDEGNLYTINNVTEDIITIKITKVDDKTFQYGEITINFTNSPLFLYSSDGKKAELTFNKSGKEIIDKKVKVTPINTEEGDKTDGGSTEEAKITTINEYLQPFNIVSNNYNQYVNSSAIEKITLKSVTFMTTDGITTIGEATVEKEAVGNEEKREKLATDKILKSYSGTEAFVSYQKEEKEKYSEKNPASFTVGYLDSYVYGEGHESGSGKSVTANVVITLVYEDGNDSETATVIINSATISREYPETLVTKDVHDGLEFTVKNSIIKSSNTSLEDENYKIYNDTLEVVLDPSVNITFDLTATTSATKKDETDNYHPNYSSSSLIATVTRNAIYGYKARYYVGISNSFAKAIDNTYKIEISNIKSSGYYEIRYNGKTIVSSNGSQTGEFVLKEIGKEIFNIETGEFELKEIGKETFNIENSAQWEGGDVVVKTKYYLVNPLITKADDKTEKNYFYRYRVDYNVKRAYDVEVASQIVVDEYYKTNNGYVIPINCWGLDNQDKIKLKTSGKNYKAMEYSDVYKFNYVINTSHSGSSGSAGAAFVDENGTIYTTSGFNITYHEIVLDMYLKASGFNGKFEDANMDRDKKVGTITIKLNNLDEKLVDAVTEITKSGLYMVENGFPIYIGINVSLDETGYIKKTGNASTVSKVDVKFDSSNEFYISMDSGRRENAELKYEDLKSLIGADGDFVNYHIYKINDVYYNSSNLNSWTFTETGKYTLGVIKQSGTDRKNVSYHEIIVYVYDVADIEEESYAIDYSSHVESGGTISIDIKELIKISDPDNYKLSEESVNGDEITFNELSEGKLTFYSKDVNKIISKRILATNDANNSIKTYLLTFYIYNKNASTTETYQEVKFAVAGENSFEIRSLKDLVNRTGEPTFYKVDSSSGKMSILNVDYITTLKSDNDTIKQAYTYLMVYNTTNSLNNIMYLEVFPYVYSNTFTGYLPVVYNAGIATSGYDIQEAIEANIIRNSSLNISEIDKIKIYEMHNTINSVFVESEKEFTSQTFASSEQNKQVMHKYFVEYTFGGRTKFASVKLNYYVATEEIDSFDYVSEVINSTSLASIFKSKINNPSTAPKFYEIIDGEVSNEETTNIQLTNANSTITKRYLVYHINNGEKYSIANIKIYIYSDLIADNINVNVYEGIDMKELNGLTLYPNAKKEYYYIDDENNLISFDKYTKNIANTRGNRDLVIVTTLEDDTILIKRYSGFNITVYDKEELYIAIDSKDTAEYNLYGYFGKDVAIYSIDFGVNLGNLEVNKLTGNLNLSEIKDKYFLVKKNDSMKMYHVNIKEFDSEKVEFIEKDYVFDLFADIEINSIVNLENATGYYILSDVNFDSEGNISVTEEELKFINFSSYESATLKGETENTIENYTFGKYLTIVVKIEGESVTYKVVQINLIPPVEVECNISSVNAMEGKVNFSDFVKISRFVNDSNSESDSQEEKNIALQSNEEYLTISYNKETLNGVVYLIWNDQNDQKINLNNNIDDSLFDIGNSEILSIKIVYEKDSYSYELGTYNISIVITAQE